MTTPTGTIALSNVDTELGVASNTTIRMGQANVRSLAGVASGPISMSSLRGKSSYVATGTLSAVNPSNATYSYGYEQSNYGALTNSNSSNFIYEFQYFSLTGKTYIYTNNVGGSPWTSNPTQIVFTMNGVTATMIWNGADYAYEITGDVFNIQSLVGGPAKPWSYK